MKKGCTTCIYKYRDIYRWPCDECVGGRKYVNERTAAIVKAMILLFAFLFSLAQSFYV